MLQSAARSYLGPWLMSLSLFAPAVAREINPAWLEGDDYAELEAVGAANQHPAQFSAEQLQGLLMRFQKQAMDKQAVPYFSDDERKRLSKWLVGLFARATPGDDVLFGTSYRQGNMLFMPRSLNAGRLFVSEGRLHLLVGTCGEQLDVSLRQRQGSRQLNHGSRIKPVADMGCELLAGQGAEQVNNRPDWLSVDIGLKAAPPLPGTTPKPAGPNATSVLPARSSTIEERLILLKHWYENGLISDAEYEQKRAAILKDL